MRVTRTYLEMRHPSQLAARRLQDEGVRVNRVERCHPSLWRRLYEGVGSAHHWTDRLSWTDEEITTYLSDPAISLWVLTVRGEVAGYFELRREADGAIEVAYFGLLPEHIGRGLGAHLLTTAVDQAWADGATRVWLHTNTLDHPAALPNYLKAGFVIVGTDEYER